MSNVDKLIALGAQAVGGDLVWKGQLLGQFRNGEFLITPEGEAAMNIEDVEVREVKPRRKKEEAPAAEGEAPSTDDVQIEV